MMRSSARTLGIVLLLAAASAFGQQSPPSVLGASPVPRTPIVTIELHFSETSGDEVAGKVVATIDPRWHINSATPKDDFAIPTVLAIDSAALETTAIDYPPHVEKAFAFAGGTLAVYEGRVEIPFRAKLKGSGRGDVTATLRYQACDDKVCLPPRDVSVTVGYPPGSAPSSGTPAPSGGGARFTPLDQAPKETSLFSGDIGSTLESRGLLLTLLVVFVLGLALNLTPCVYPLIPITVAYFSSQTEGKRSRQIALSLSYVLGLALTYSALGVFAALSGQLFGAWLQLPAVLVFFAVLMIVLSASMFGLYDIRVPQFIAGRAGARGGVAGATTMGLLAGIVAAPCVGPFIVSLIALVSQSGNALLGFLLFFILALGLGAPYLVLAVFTTSLNALPRSGVWLVQIKQAMGFILIAMAFYFLRPLTGDEVYRWGVGLSLLVGALFLFFAKQQGTSGRAVRNVSAGLLLLLGAFFLVPRAAGANVSWIPYDEQTLARAAAAGQPVMIDFYADWCLPCKELDEKTFTDSRVIEESARFVRLKADLTRTADEKTQRLSAQYNILGVPTIVFIDSRGAEVVSERLVGFEKPERFVERMRGVR